MISDIEGGDERSERYVLKGLTARLIADSDEDDLVKVSPGIVKLSNERNIYMFKNNSFLTAYLEA